VYRFLFRFFIEGVSIIEINACHIKNALNCVIETSCGCRLNFTLWSLRLPIPRWRLRIAIMRFAFVLQRCIKAMFFSKTILCCHGKFTFRSKRNQFTQRSRFSDDGWAPVFRFVSNDGKERSLYTQYRLFLSFYLLRQGFTHRRWCSQENCVRTYRWVILRLHYAKIKFTESFRQRRDEFVEAWMLRVSAEDSKL